MFRSSYYPESFISEGKEHHQLGNFGTSWQGTSCWNKVGPMCIKMTAGNQSLTQGEIELVTLDAAPRIYIASLWPGLFTFVFIPLARLLFMRRTKCY